MLRMLSLCACTIGLMAACANTDDAAPDELTPAEIAALPDATVDLDHSDLAAIQEIVQDDGALFDTADAVEGIDAAVDDDDDPSDDAGGATSVIYYAPILKWGLHPRASDALRSINVPTWRIMQTIGNAAASAGTHAQDGSVNGHPYSAATDISVSGLSDAQIRNLLERLGKVGFAAWFRWPGHDGWPSSQVRHIHAVYANSKMKSSLRSQVRSWLVGRNGLVSNTHYNFHVFSAAAKTTVRHKFTQSANGTTNGGSNCFVGGNYCGGDKISGNTRWLYRCTGAGAPTLVRKCAYGCAVRSGQNDACK
ncbi:MAG: hypothetical protein JWO36_3764 [Myxococcales bacterium]|nr:hypothetical protein [Myxococcales bacterium]